MTMHSAIPTKMGLFIISSVAAGLCCGASLLTVFWNKCRRNANCLTEFQKSKLQHEFKMFFDLDGDGVINWTDFELARNNRNNGLKKRNSYYKESTENH
uniref:EF-hand domain-containing protein n=1 Tax=Romanomermis culicivorax TaxID=13658 RepID=A0A915HVR3_ROMCU